VRVIRHACRLGSEAVAALMRAASPGASAAEAAAAAARVVVGGGAMVYCVSLSSGARITNFTGRPFPGFDPDHCFRTGEPTRLDLSLVYEGYYCDLARSWVIGGGDRNPAAAELVAAVRTALDEAVAAARPGATAGDVACAGIAALPASVSAEYPIHWGHGLGMGWEGPWLLPDSAEPIEEGFTLAIERSGRTGEIVMAGEHDVLVTRDGPEVLTSSPWEAEE
jgi:Xaa-Pro dipeptidase